MTQLFGTDGIRGKANTYPMTADMALKTGRAVARFFQERASSKQSADFFIIGRDTRLSGQMLETALSAGILSMGGEVMTAGVFPTPGVAFLTAHLHAAAGIVISASHNPYADNGIKLFGADGCKLDDHSEAEIERLILAADNAEFSNDNPNIGQVCGIENAREAYRAFLGASLGATRDISPLRIVLDGANGATSHLAMALFADLGATVTALSMAPDGRNINQDCGSQHPEKMARQVSAVGADLGLAFDGDGDRVIAADETGRVLSGDQLIAIAAHHWRQIEALKNNTVVTTVMSNLGLGEALAGMNVKHAKTKVGDRYVMQKMRATGAVIGGEDSGHIIFADYHTTGDGLLAALQIIKIMQHSGKSLSELAKVMRVYPQCLVNVEVCQKPDLDSVPAIRAAIQSVEQRLADTGRVLVRYSGTQAICRVMVEAQTEEAARAFADEIAAVISEYLNTKPSCKT